jgi:hypothetical protein
MLEPDQSIGLTVRKKLSNGKDGRERFHLYQMLMLLSYEFWPSSNSLLDITIKASGFDSKYERAFWLSIPKKPKLSGDFVMTTSESSTPIFDGKATDVIVAGESFTTIGPAARASIPELAAEYKANRFGKVEPTSILLSNLIQLVDTTPRIRGGIGKTASCIDEQTLLGCFTSVLDHPEAKKASDTPLMLVCKDIYDAIKAEEEKSN